MAVHVPEPGQFFGGPNSCFKVQRHVVRLHGKLTVLKPDVVKAPPGGTTVRGLSGARSIPGQLDRFEKSHLRSLVRLPDRYRH